MNLFKIIGIITSLLFAYLFVTLLTKPEGFCVGVGMQANETASVIVRRAAMFMLGISVLFACSFNLKHSRARQNICISTAITMLGLACMGSYEYARGVASSSIFVSVIIESIIGIAFLIVFLLNLKLNQALKTND